MVPLPSACEVLTFLGEAASVADEDQAALHTRTVALMVKAYTRGRGFVGEEVEDDLGAVIVTTAARLYTNPDMRVRTETGSHSEVPGLFNGFTLPELAVLHRYRRRTA
jgi:hypothetical protein